MTSPPTDWELHRLPLGAAQQNKALDVLGVNPSLSKASNRVRHETEKKKKKKKKKKIG
jgi:hypothetical protein